MHGVFSSLACNTINQSSNHRISHVIKHVVGSVHASVATCEVKLAKPLSPTLLIPLICCERTLHCYIDANCVAPHVVPVLDKCANAPCMLLAALAYMLRLMRQT